MFKKATIYLVSISILFSGCSTAPQNISTTYVSPMQYKNYDCDQLVAEAERIKVRVSQLNERLSQASGSDKVMTGVGLVLFWPILFALGGTKAEEAEFARLKGEYEAVQKASVEKKCTNIIETLPTAPPVKIDKEQNKAPANRYM
jgi:hypothetical protein